MCVKWYKLKKKEISLTIYLYGEQNEALLYISSLLTHLTPDCEQISI